MIKDSGTRFVDSYKRFISSLSPEDKEKTYNPYTLAGHINEQALENIMNEKKEG